MMFCFSPLINLFPNCSQTLERLITHLNILMEYYDGSDTDLLITACWYFFVRSFRPTYEKIKTK